MIDKIARRALDETFCFTKEDYEDVDTLICAKESVSEFITSYKIRLFICLIFSMIVTILLNIRNHHVGAIVFAIVGSLVCLACSYIVSVLERMSEILYEKITELLQKNVVKDSGTITGLNIKFKSKK